jgi:hypothetical protein
MRIFYKGIILVVLLLAALASYDYGFSQGVVIFIVLGVMLELIFWLGIFAKKQKKVKH